MANNDNSTVVTLYVGNISYSLTIEALREAFAQAGALAVYESNDKDQDENREKKEKKGPVNIITDRMTGRSRGFAFVDMATEEDAEKAIEMWHEKELEGRKLIVNKARPREERPPRREGVFQPRRDFDQAA